MNANPSNPESPPQQGSEANQTRYFPPQGYTPPMNQPQGQPYYNPASAADQTTRSYQPVGAPPQGAPVPAPHHHEHNRTALGLLLVSAGVLFLLSQLGIFGDFGDLFLLMLGGIFLYAYYNTRQSHRIGFLIPGAILSGIGVGQVVSNFAFADGFGADVHALFLGLGFCLIWFLERKHWWALIPGGILVMSSISTVFMVGRFWPLALIALGVYMIYDQSRRRPTR
ncbi:MAG: hypothetical protein M3014_12550 [Chloroflexota bacterium]|nr:hypothetical protein [Chloroflexota bacterium]